MRRVLISAATAALAAGLLVQAGPARADTADTRSAVTTTTPVNTDVDRRISGGSDQDWYRFRMNSSAWARVTMTLLPGNYRLDLYNENGALLASSTRPYRQLEEIYHYLPAGTYYVRVASQDGSYDGVHTYRLRFGVPQVGVRLLSQSFWRDPVTHRVNYVCDLINNTSSRQIIINLEAAIYDAGGHFLAHASASALPYILPPHSHGVCFGEFDTTHTVARLHLSVDSYGRTTTVSPPLSVRPSAAVADPAGGADFRGVVYNYGTRSVRDITVWVAVYGSYGIRDLVSGELQQTSVAARSTAPFTPAHTLRAGPTAFARYWAVAG